MPELDDGSLENMSQLVTSYHILFPGLFTVLLWAGGFHHGGGCHGRRGGGAWLHGDQEGQQHKSGLYRSPWAAWFIKQPPERERDKSLRCWHWWLPTVRHWLCFGQVPDHELRESRKVVQPLRSLSPPLSILHALSIVSPSHPVLPSIFIPPDFDVLN